MRISAVFQFALLCAAAFAAAPLFADETIAVAAPVKIWDVGGHNAFTDIIRFNGRFYVTFREGTGHVPAQTTGVGDGTVRVLRSDDGKTWESAALLKRAGFDLRDAKLSETPDGRLMVTIGGSVYVNGQLVSRMPQVSFSDKDGENFSSPADALIDETIRSPFDWLWRVTWNEGVGYGVVYQIAGGDYHGDQTEWNLWLVKTTDGVHYEKVAKLDVSGKPNEATVRFAPDGSMRMLVRRESGDYHTLLGQSAAPFTEWSRADTGESIGGPNLIVLPESGVLFGGGRVKGKTDLGVFGADGKYRSLVTLPSDGDNSYPGFCRVGDTLYVSYYSSHEGKTSIYLTTIDVRSIRP